MRTLIGGDRRGDLGRAVGAAALVCGLPLLGARPAAAAVDADVQTHYLGCLAQYDADAYAGAATCLAEVYAELVAIDPKTRTDLYYVLADGALARRAAARSDGDPRHLCEASALIDDYLGRGGRRERVRFRRKVRALRAEFDAALEEAAQAASSSVGELCAARAEPAVNKDAALEAAATETWDEGKGGADEGEAQAGARGEGEGPPAPPVAADPEAPVAGSALARTADPRSPTGRRGAPRQLRAQPATSMTDAGFAATIGGVALLGGGVALALVDVRCAEGPPRCEQATSPALGDAGLALIGVGVSAAVTGLLLRWIDHRRLRRASVESTGQIARRRPPFAAF
ncbi:MAG: hypothetical protein R3A79_19380 [Nannocystaceae bacterium]